MSKICAALLFCLSFTRSALAMDLVQVPIVCGSVDEVNQLLSLKMDDSTALGEGSDKHGQRVAALFTTEDRWAVVTKSPDGRVCIVASGRNWQVMEQTSANPT